MLSSPRSALVRLSVVSLGLATLGCRDPVEFGDCPIEYYPDRRCLTFDVDVEGVVVGAPEPLTLALRLAGEAAPALERVRLELTVTTGQALPGAEVVAIAGSTFPVVVDAPVEGALDNQARLVVEVDGAECGGVSPCTVPIDLAFDGVPTVDVPIPWRAEGSARLRFAEGSSTYDELCSIGRAP